MALFANSGSAAEAKRVLNHTLGASHPSTLQAAELAGA
jgi:hypothetical protein